MKNEYNIQCCREYPMIRESGEIGRRARLRGVWLSVRVQVPSLAPKTKRVPKVLFLFFAIKMEDLEP